MMEMVSCLDVAAAGLLELEAVTFRRLKMFRCKYSFSDLRPESKTLLVLLFMNGLTLVDHPFYLTSYFVIFPDLFSSSFTRNVRTWINIPYFTKLFFIKQHVCTLFLHLVRF